MFLHLPVFALALAASPGTVPIRPTPAPIVHHLHWHPHGPLHLPR